jgi:hypothetical protein
VPILWLPAAATPTPMHRLLRHSLVVAWLVAASCATSAGPVDPPHEWSRLRFEHHGLALDAALEIARDTLPATAFPADDSAPTGALRPAGGTVGRLVARSVFGLPPLLSRHRSSVLWFEPSNHSALVGTRETIGMGAGYKVSHYTGSGVHVAKASPASRAERARAPGTWTAIAESFAGYGEAARLCSVVSEPLMLLLLDPARLPKGFCVTSKRVLLRAVFSGPVEEDLISEVRMHRTDGTTDYARFTRVRRYVLQLVPVDGSRHTDGSEAFLGLQGKVEIRVDARTAIPIGLRGKASLLGRVDFRLREIWPANH